MNLYIYRQEANTTLDTIATSTLTVQSLKSTEQQPLVGSHIDPNAAFEAVRENRALLLTAIADPLVLATELYSKKIISKVALDKIRELPFTTHQKADIIMNSIESRIRTHPQDFCTLLGILACDQCDLCIFAESLRHSYSK